MSKIFLLAIFILSSVSVFAQDTQPMTMPQPSPQPSPASLDTILNEAAKQTLNYRETFRDLLATETKTFEKYKKDGNPDDTTKVESNFFVYQSSKDGKTSSELRNVTKVNDKPVPDSQSRADRFLGELQKAKTVEKELEKIQDESLRHDKSIRISGFTLFEAIVLAENLRPNFEFNLDGTENYQDGDVYVVSYRQTRKTPFITVNEKATNETGLKADFDVSVPGSLKKTDKFLQGKLWIDAQTFQLVREQRQVVVQTSPPIIVQETVFEYERSQYEIFVPKKIIFTDYTVKKGSGKNNFTTLKNARMTFDYSEFKRTNVDIEILDDDVSN
jgi:hypothetical protein